MKIIKKMNKLYFIYAINLEKKKKWRIGRRKKERK